MRKISITLIILLIFIGCKERKTEQKTISAPQNDTPIVFRNSSSSKSNATWVDSLIIKYINQTDNELIKVTRKDSIPIEWMFDRTENTDSAKYLVFQLGHSFENKYITDSWLYIDSLTRSIYEYNVAVDSLIKWQQ